MRFAYADPPYIGQARRRYGYPEVDHADLVGRLVREFPDGWALSCSSPTLRVLLPICPEDVRIGAWVKPFHVFKRGVRPAYGWEPVIFRGGRNKKHPPPAKGAEATTPRDWISANITLRKGLVGAKPLEFSWWIFAILGMQASDELVDLFPGTGAVTEAWAAYCEMARKRVVGPLFATLDRGAHT